MSDTYPVNKLHSYVAVGPTEDLSISVHKETFDSAFLITTIFLFIGYIIIVIVIIYYTNLSISNNIIQPVFTSTVAIQQRPLNINDNFGASSNGYSHSLINKIINDGTDLNENTCNKGYYGNKCDMEFHNNKYTAVGIINSNNLNANIIDKYTTDNKSFIKSKNDTSCTQLCDNNNKCSAVYYYNNMCILYNGKITIPNSSKITYSLNTESSLYIKDVDDLQFSDSIYLSSSLNFPVRYWAETNNQNFVKLFPNKVEKICFIPKSIKYNKHYIGFYSIQQFNYQDVEKILLENDDNNFPYISGTYIHLPNDYLQIPNEIFIDIKICLYVIYIRLPYIL